MDWKTAFESDPRFGGLYRKVARPAWPTRAAILSGLLVVVLPLMLVILTGLVVGVLVYVVGSFLAKIGEVFSGPAGNSATASADRYAGDDVRENVRVMQR